MTAESIVKKLVTDNCLYSIDRKLNYDLRYSECKKIIMLNIFLGAIKFTDFPFKFSSTLLSKVVDLAT